MTNGRICVLAINHSATPLPFFEPIQEERLPLHRHLLRPRLLLLLDMHHLLPHLISIPVVKRIQCHLLSHLDIMMLRWCFIGWIDQTTEFHHLHLD
ncbi:hypothetical protein B9Z55_014085 [Caenorhabditis nigoni]|uniref:Uncharacterized protein n=1 Tax=Caenorhabditis nigoni TaxID=1611254 RepID=A0A2G5U4I5_9PELO|nr:hypothetical protein B9Z55_014085 [Caenorhabditis nigoni]